MTGVLNLRHTTTGYAAAGGSGSLGTPVRKRHSKAGCFLLHGACTMRQFSWQVDVTGVANFIKVCFAVLDAPV